MKYPIGFVFEEEPQEVGTEMTAAPSATPAKSLAQVFFPEKGQTLTYFNDLFDLKRGDIVFVEGKLEGIRGVVREVNKNFKIKVSDYKKVISVADTKVSGQLNMAGSHFVSFDAAVLPYEKLRLWFKAPDAEGEEYVSGDDGKTFPLEGMGPGQFEPEIFARGLEYYNENRVRYLCLEGDRGRAIVEGTESYELEFRYSEGEISALSCSCFCSYNCKHELAALLQLKELLAYIEENYADDFRRSGYFAAVDKLSFFTLALAAQSSGSISL